MAGNPKNNDVVKHVVTVQVIHLHCPNCGEEKDEIMVEYAMLNDTSKLIVSKYQLYLPEKAVLINKLQNLLS